MVLGLLMIAGVAFTSCKNNSSDSQTEAAAGVQPEIGTAKVEWTAYKTTDKIPVKGEFTKVTIDDYTKSDNWEEAVNGLQFTISSFNISTNDPDRDQTIVDNFFAKMMEAGTIKGEVMKENENWFVNLNMNGVKVDELPATVTFENNVAHLTTTINLDQFNALDALASLNKACGDLHKGADGVSKTWEEVSVSASLEFK